MIVHVKHCLSFCFPLLPLFSKQRRKTFASYLIQKGKFVVCIRQRSAAEEGKGIVELKMHKDDVVSFQAQKNL